MLRTDLFKTVDRAETRFIAVRDTLTRPDKVEETDAKTLDAIHCKQGRLGIGYHFLIILGGVIQLCRNVDTCGSHSRDLDELSVAIGIVGGTDADGNRSFTRTPEQQEALDDLIEFLARKYPEASVDDHPGVIKAHP